MELEVTLSSLLQLMHDYGHVRLDNVDTVHLMDTSTVHLMEVHCSSYEHVLFILWTLFASYGHCSSSVAIVIIIYSTAVGLQCKL